MLTVHRTPGRGHGNPLQYCLENPHGQSLVGRSPWGHKESDTTEWLSLSLVVRIRCFHCHNQTSTSGLELKCHFKPLQAKATRDQAGESKLSSSSDNSIIYVCRWTHCLEKQSVLNKALLSAAMPDTWHISFVPLRQLYHIRSDQISRSVVSDSLRPHESQQARPPCPSPTPGVHWDSRPSSQWCHPAILSSVIPFSSCPQSLPASESFPMSQLFAWGGS